MVLGTLETLGEAIESLEIGFDSSELAQAHRLLDQLKRVCVADGEFDAGEGWDLDAATSMTAWLRTQAGMTAGDAAYAVRVAKRLRSLPGTSAAFLDGTLSGGQVKAIVACVSKRTVERFAGQEADLVPLLVPLAAADLAVAMRQWKALAEADLDDDEPKDEPESSVHLSSLLEGRWRLHGDLGALDGETLATALRLASSSDAEGEARTPAQRRAAAMVDICSFFLQRHDHPAGSRQSPPRQRHRQPRGPGGEPGRNLCRRGGPRRPFPGLAGLPLGIPPGAGVRLFDLGLRNRHQDHLGQPL